MERTPGDYASWLEEQLRDSLLVMLITHYEGLATGETFNKGGRDDILVREGDRNVFVGECKWLGGRSVLIAGVDRNPPSALDQLFANTPRGGMRSSRRSRSSCRTRSIGNVLSSAQEALQAHPAFQRWTHTACEGLLRCRIRMMGDVDRAADLAVVFVHLPTDYSTSLSSSSPGVTPSPFATASAVLSVG